MNVKTGNHLTGNNRGLLVMPKNQYITRNSDKYNQMQYGICRDNCVYQLQ